MKQNTRASSRLTDCSLGVNSLRTGAQPQFGITQKEAEDEPMQPRLMTNVDPTTLIDSGGASGTVTQFFHTFLRSFERSR